MFKIKANPTFPAVVKIRQPGGESQELRVVFRHKRKDDVQKFFSDAAEQNRPDADCLLELIESWEADEKLSRDSIAELIQNYPAASLEILTAYRDELFNARLGN